MKTKTRSIALMSILIAIMLLMGFVPNLGFIQIGPIAITLMCIPVIVATMVLGLRTGIAMGALFAIISIAKMFMMPDAFSAMVVDDFGTYGFFYILCLLIPRLLIPIVTYAVSKIKMKKDFLSYGLSSLAGSLTNTALYLILLSAMLTPMICAFYGVDAAGAVAVVWGVVLMNGLPEAIFAMLICPPIIKALKKSVPMITTKKEKA